MIHPTITSRWYAGSVGGGVWRSNFSGATWEPIADEMSNLAIGCMTFDPANADIIYAGTGEGFGNGDSIRGDGIWRSLDGGDSWAQLPSTDNADFDYVTRIAVSPSNSANILASTANGVFRSTDSGASWTRELTLRGLQVAWDPNDSNNAVASVRGTQVVSGGLFFAYYTYYSTDAMLNLDRLKV